MSVLSSLASDILAWTALAAPRDQDQTPARCFAASCMPVRDPHQLPVELLAMSGMGPEVRAYLREFAPGVSDLPGVRLEAEAAEASAAVAEEVRGFLARLRAHEATSADGQRLGRQLLATAIALDPIRAERDEIGSPSLVGAFGLLERALPTDHSDERDELKATLELFAVELPGLVEHAQADLESEDEDEPEYDDDVLDEDEEGEFSLDGLIYELDVRLSVTEDAGDAADVASELAFLLLAHGVVTLGPSRLTFGPQARGLAAVQALLPPNDPDRERAPFDRPESRALLEAVYAEAASLLRAEGAGQLVATGSVEELLRDLDQLVAAMLEVAEGETDGGLAERFVLTAGAAQALRVSLRLGHEKADRRQRMAAALGILDPLALADLPEARASAAEALAEMAGTEHAR